MGRDHAIWDVIMLYGTCGRLGEQNEARNIIDYTLLLSSMLFFHYCLIFSQLYVYCISCALCQLAPHLHRKSARSTRLDFKVQECCDAIMPQEESAVNFTHLFKN